MNDEVVFQFSSTSIATSTTTTAIALRRASNADLSAVTAIHTSAFRRMVRRRVGWSATAQDADVARTLLDAHSYCIVLCRNDAVVGHVLLERVVDQGDDTGDAAPVEHCSQQLLLSRIMLARRWRNRGIGTAVLRHIIATVHAANFTLSLTVWRENRRARRLYHRLGFLLGERDGHKIAMTCPPPSTNHVDVVATASSDDGDDDDDADDDSLSADP